MSTATFYLASILLANWMVHQFGIVHWWFLSFPAGAVAIGITFSARDLMQQRWGKWGCWGWMTAATAITVAFNPRLAMASGCAFIVSEAVDWAVFTGIGGSLQKRMIWSNLVGTPIDSVLFVLLAFGPIWQAMWGQTIVKFASSLLVVFGMRAYAILCRNTHGQPC